MLGTGLGQGPSHRVRVRMAGRDDVVVCVCDAVAPAAVRHEAWAAHAVTVLNTHAAPHEVAIPSDPSLTGVRPPRLMTYLSGRYCALRALRAAGYEADGVPLGDAGAPAWPAGVVGSISHTATRALAVVGPTAHWRGIGVDCEHVLDTAAADEIVGDVVAEADAVDVVAGGSLEWAEFVTIGFSAKESLYKCLRPIVGTFFDFTDAHLIQLNGDTGRARIRLVRDLAPEFVRGRTFELAWSVVDAHVYTCLALPATAGPTASENVL